MMKAKKFFSRLAIAVLTLCMMFGTLFAFAACNDGTRGGGDVNIVLSATNATVQVGKTFRLTGTLELDGAKITWSSEDESIATVSATGVIKGVKVGKTNIKATYENISAKCEVTVIDEVTVSLNKTELALNVGAEETLTATASNGGTVAWSSSDASVAKVEGGKVTALKEGTAYIYAECDGTRATCEVTVTDPSRKKITKCAFDQITELDTMFYFDVDGATASVDDMYYSVADETYHAKFDNSGWAWYGFQLFFIKSDIEGSNNTMSFTLNSSAAGHITVNGTPITLVVGDNDISLDNNTGSLSMQFGLDNGQNANDITGTVTVTISKLTFTPYTPEKLTAPTAFTLDAQNKKITVTDTANADHVQSYRVVFYQDNEKKGEAVLDKDGKFDDGKIPDGEYTLKVYAYSTGKYTSSDEFGPDPAVTYTVANGGIQYDLTFKAEADIDEGTWYYWKDASTVTAKFQGGKLNVEFTNNTGNWYATQLFYLDPVADKTRPNNKITFTLKSNKAGHISVNGNVIEIKEADIDKEVEYSVYNLGSGKATVSIQMGVNGSGIDISDANMTFTFEDPMVSTYEPQKLATPSIAIDSETLGVTITDDTNDAANVDGYGVYIYDSEQKLVQKMTLAEKTGTLEMSSLAAGTYTVKVTAIGSGRFAESDMSEGIEVTPPVLDAITVAISENTLTVTDTNDSTNVVSYLVKIYKENDLYAVMTGTEKIFAIDPTSFVTGTYTVKATAIGKAPYLSSPESQGVEYNVENANGTDYAMANGDEAASLNETNAGKWIYWNDQNWCGSATAVTKAQNSGDNIVLNYSCSSGACSYGIQLFKKITTLNTGDKYVVKFTLYSEKDVTVALYGTTYTLKAGEAKEIEVEVTQAEGKASISIQIDVKNGDDNVLVLGGIIVTSASTEDTPAE